MRYADPPSLVQEFLAATMERQMINYQQHIWEAFCQYDVDGDGRITVDEMRAALSGEPAEVVERYLAEFDVDGDGAIDYEEFVRQLLPREMKFRVSKLASPRRGGGGDGEAGVAGSWGQADGDAAGAAPAAVSATAPPSSEVAGSGGGGAGASGGGSTTTAASTVALGPHAT